MNECPWCYWSAYFLCILCTLMQRLTIISISYEWMSLLLLLSLFSLHFMHINAKGNNQFHMNECPCILCILQGSHGWQGPQVIGINEQEFAAHFDALKRYFWKWWFTELSWTFPLPWTARTFIHVIWNFHNMELIVTLCIYARKISGSTTRTFIHIRAAGTHLNMVRTES